MHYYVRIGVGAFSVMVIVLGLGLGISVVTSGLDSFYELSFTLTLVFIEICGRVRICGKFAI